MIENEETSTIQRQAARDKAAYVSIRQHTSAYVSIRQHTSAYVSIRQHAYRKVDKQLLVMKRQADAVSTFQENKQLETSSCLSMKRQAAS